MTEEAAALKQKSALIKISRLFTMVACTKRTSTCLHGMTSAATEKRINYVKTHQCVFVKPFDETNGK